jgi:hypothetical protein
MSDAQEEKWVFCPVDGCGWMRFDREGDLDEFACMFPFCTCVRHFGACPSETHQASPKDNTP